MRVVPLDEPLQRGDEKITHITIRKPDSGALRGVSLIALGQIDVIALQTVLPRVSTPMLTPLELARLDPADLMALGTAVASFLLTKADRAKYLI
ncbi:phage tail protein [Achromobacter sp. UMC71]|nr:phage tail protein [Achromobacter sp. UMC71]